MNNVVKILISLIALRLVIPIGFIRLSGNGSGQNKAPS
jgi:hypothetical protein